RIVILNEVDFIPRHRVFATQVALELRKQGFEYLAVEALRPETIGRLNNRERPAIEDGRALKEPLFADFIRQSMHAGYRLESYFKLPKPLKDVVANTNAFEEAQADELIANILKRDRKSRVLVYATFEHGYKGFSTTPEGGRIEWLAERLRARSGIDPLCIDQVAMIEPVPGSRDRALLDAIYSDRTPESVVLASRKNSGEFMVFDRTRVDLQVFHRPTVMVDGRPDWMAMDGYRKPLAVPDDLLGISSRKFLVQAFDEDESEIAVPLDQILVTPGIAPPKFMLPDRKYHFDIQ